MALQMHALFLLFIRKYFLNSVHIIDCRPEGPNCSKEDESACEDFTFRTNCPRKCGRCRELLIILRIIGWGPYLLVAAAPPLPKQRGAVYGRKQVAFLPRTTLRKLCVIT